MIEGAKVKSLKRGIGYLSLELEKAGDTYVLSVFVTPNDTLVKKLSRRSGGNTEILFLEEEVIG